MIRITEVHLTEAAEQAVSRVLRSGRLAQGPMVAEFEERFAAVTGCTHAVAVSSGTAALVAAVQALELGAGDEVITTAFTFVATLNAIIESGATAVLVDIGSDDFSVDPSLVEAAITPATRAIVPVHLYGYPADMARLGDIARRHDLALPRLGAQAGAVRDLDLVVVRLTGLDIWIDVGRSRLPQSNDGRRPEPGSFDTPLHERRQHCLVGRPHKAHGRCASC